MKNPLAAFGWDYVVTINQDLCKKSGYQHGTTSDGYDDAKAFFHAEASKPKMDMAAVTETLRLLHKKAPFLFLNGNTFATVGKTMLALVLDNHSGKIRSIVGHHIAGTEIMSKKELEEAFKKESSKQQER